VTLPVTEYDTGICETSAMRIAQRAAEHAAHIDRNTLPSRCPIAVGTVVWGYIIRQ